VHHRPGRRPWQPGMARPRGQLCLLHALAGAASAGPSSNSQV